MASAPNPPTYNDPHGDAPVDLPGAAPEESRKPAPPVSPRATRRALLIGGTLSLLFGVYVLAFLVPDLIKTVGGPEHLSMVEAGDTASRDQIFAEIEGGVWQCDTIVYIKGWSSSSASTGTRRIVTKSTEIFLTDQANLPNVVVLVTESGEKSCEDFEGSTVDGYLERMSGSKQQELTNEVRLAQFPGATSYLEMCAYCGPGNSAIGAGFGVVATIGGAVLVFFGRRVRVDQDEDAAQE